MMRTCGLDVLFAVCRALNHKVSCYRPVGLFSLNRFIFVRNWSRNFFVYLHNGSDDSANWTFLITPNSIIWSLLSCGGWPSLFRSREYKRQSWASPLNPRNIDRPPQGVGGDEGNGNFEVRGYHSSKTEAVTKLVPSAKSGLGCSTFVFPALPCRATRLRATRLEHSLSHRHIVPPSFVTASNRDEWGSLDRGSARSQRLECVGQRPREIKSLGHPPLLDWVRLECWR
jgi:hypothetical protein